ncbi:hypothetical protein SISNIDRAFT_471001 [Sistotremastrum niveocremeum HHB9708]|uniref:Uncharacterized protein n=1 Tax=Sistotremastrum niveocremeum HHB9708 TaxID=1314777 RepID=A0A164N499_9AGAM|nr:hypothetical protein SISNIDRAFT_471001 [Sistotremastrum niveocremeum HHB9708]
MMFAQLLGGYKRTDTWLDVASNGDVLLLRIVNYRIGATIILSGSAETEKIGYGRFKVASGTDWPNSKQEGTFTLTITENGSDSNAELKVSFPNEGGPYTITGAGEKSSLNSPESYNGRATTFTRIV